MRILATVALLSLPMSPALAAGPIVGGFAFNYVDADYGGPIAPATTFNIATNGSVVAAGANRGPGASNSVASQSGAWLNRIAIASDATRGFVYGSALSTFAINQTVTGTPGSIAHVSYTFGIDGSFAPGPSSHYLPPSVVPPQNSSFYLLAYAGSAISLSDRTDTDGRYLFFDTTAGHNTVSRAAGSRGYSNTLAPFLAAASACFGADTRCTAGGTFADQRTINFDVAVGRDYFVVGYLSSLTDGQTDFFHTAKLVSVGLAPQFGLVSDDGGALVRNPNGTFQLAVPEPSVWAMLVAGFGAAGAALRRRRSEPAAG